MYATLHISQDTTLRVDLSRPHAIAIPMDFDGPQPSAFGLGRATQAPLCLEAFTTQVSKGGAVNCMQLTLWPHGNGTHTETVGHLLATPPPIGTVHPGFQVAALVSVEPELLGASGEHYPAPGEASDQVITRRALEAALTQFEEAPARPGALVIRTLPHDDEAKRGRTYSNPPYLTSEAMRWLRHTLEIEHLLLDVPSVDREEDDGKLSNHRLFWDVEEGSTQPGDEHRAACTITEMVLASSVLVDGFYVLHIELPALLTDAVPSRPILYMIEP